MNLFKTTTLILSALFLFSCSSNKSTIIQEQKKNVNSFNLLVGQFSEDIEKNWGQDLIIPEVNNYVQYRDDFKTRLHINFVLGKLVIETVNPNYTYSLYQATVQALLMDEPKDIIGVDTEYNPAQVPFLYQQVRDNHGELIRWRWRADKFASYLVDNKVETRKTKNGKIVHYIEINLVSDHVHERALKFMPAIKKNGANYKIDPKLILAIIEVESNFNPFAVSRSDALGLMQVQRHTAGRDLYIQAGKKGEPSRSFLLDPDNNIMMGSAYLALIRDQYLTGIKNPKSLEYAMVASYNGGAGSVLRLFSSDRKKAVVLINKLTEKQFYEKLTNKHSSIETRNYLKKVSAIMNK